jgi:predicted O-methyltransferase YrrM
VSRAKSARARRLAKFFRSIRRNLIGPFAVAADEATRETGYALRRALQERAIADAAEIVRSEMSTALFCENRFENLEYALSQRPRGLILEFGVLRGTTARFIAERVGRDQIYGFDSFRGLPKRWIGSRSVSTSMDRNGALPKVPENVELVVGLFSDTLPVFLAQHPDPVGFVHIDSDIYESARDVLLALNDRLAPGAVIVFDEFFLYHGFREHEYRAFHEFVAETRRSYRFASYSGAQATVIVGEAPELLRSPTK